MDDANLSGKLGLGQLIYLGFAFLVFLAALLCVPYTNPLTQECHWSSPWSPPRYELKNMKEILSSEAMNDLANLPAAPTEYFLRNSTTEEMRPRTSLHRKIILFSFLLLMAGWFFVPPWIDQIAYRVFRRSAQPDP